MRLDDYLAVMATEDARFRALATRLAPATRIPTCPDWTVRDLLDHVIGLSRGVTWVLATHRRHPPGPGEAANWFEPSSLDELATTQQALATATPDDYWTVWPTGDPVTFWARRHAHELAIHRVDLELAAGEEVTAFDPEFAADGVDELITYLTRVRGLDITVTVTGGVWQVTFDGGTITGPATELYPMLWNRTSPRPAWQRVARWNYG